MLVLLGADPLADVPDADLATRGIAGAGTVIAVDRFLTASAEQADVVLAAAGPAEVDGTTTNLEGRVSAVTRKITAPGTAREDWMIAAELSRLLGTDLGLTSPTQILEEIAALAPSHAGLTADLLATDAGRDGLLVPLAAAPDESAASAEPDAGVDEEAGEAAVAAAAADTSEEQQAAEAEATEAQADAEAQAHAAEPEVPRGPSRPSTLTFRSPSVAATPAVDAYSLRLATHRKLYDLGTEVQHSPGLSGLVTEGSLRLHPHDFDRLGVEVGALVDVSAPKGSMRVAVVPDGSVGRGVGRGRRQPSRPRDPAADRRRGRRHRRSGGPGLMLAVDPLLVGDVDLAVVLIVLLKVVVTFALLLVSVLFMIWFERKVHADMSNRIGPNRAGPFGILQTLADGIKFFFKEDLLPDRADKRVFILAPFLSLVPAFLVFSVIPIGGVFTEEKQGTVEIFGHETFLQLADPPVGRPARARLLVDRRLRRDAGRLVLRVEVPAARLGARLSADGVLRGGPRSLGGHRRPARRLAVHPRDRHDPGRRGLRRVGAELEPHRDRCGALRDLPDRRDRRAQPTALRPRRGRAGAGRRVPHGVLVDPVRAVLPGGVHEHGR